jgi:hypothetical protein
MIKFKFHTIDLTKINGRGEFRCPECGIEISPDDETEDYYTILETVTKGDQLEYIALRCNICQSQIYLTGFQLLNRMR